MKIKILLAITMAIIVLSLLAFEGTGPRNYADCILDNIKDAQSDNAAALIAKSCRMKFPKPVVYLTEDQAFGRTTRPVE